MAISPSKGAPGRSGKKQIRDHEQNWDPDDNVTLQNAIDMLYSAELGLVPEVRHLPPYEIPQEFIPRSWRRTAEYCFCKRCRETS